MAPRVLLDSNVYIGYRYPQDEHHRNAKEQLDALPREFSLTRHAGLEVARLVRVKMTRIASVVLTIRGVRNPKVASETKVERIGRSLDNLEKKMRLGTMRRVVMGFVDVELREGRSTLNLLPEFIAESVSSIVPDINEFCGSKNLWDLPGSRTDDDNEFIAECEVVIGVRAISGKADKQIFYDVLCDSRTHRDLVFATYDWLFAKEAMEAVDRLVESGLMEESHIRVVDLNKDNI